MTQTGRNKGTWKFGQSTCSSRFKCYLKKKKQVMSLSPWLLHFRFLCLPSSFIHQRRVVDSAERCEIWRGSFLQAISGPGRPQQSSQSGGWSDEKKSCKSMSMLKSTWWKMVGWDGKLCGLNVIRLNISAAKTTLLWIIRSVSVFNQH